MTDHTNSVSSGETNPLLFVLRDAVSLGGAGTALLLSLRALKHATGPAEVQRYIALSLITGAEVTGMIWWHFHALHRQRELALQLRDVHVVTE